MLTDAAIENRMFACVDWPLWSRYITFYYHTTKSGRYRIRFDKHVLSGRNLKELDEKFKRFIMIHHLCACYKTGGVMTDYVLRSEEDIK